MYSIIAQPHHSYRVGDFLLENLTLNKWTHFRASIAFVKKSGTKYIHTALDSFSKKNDVNVSIGLDHNGSSVEGFDQLLNAIKPNGKLWVYKNSANTFHPKVYLFKNKINADIVVGSGNMTKGGLYENAEIGVRLQLDLTKSSDILFLNELEETLDIWSTAMPMRCIAVDAALVIKLHESGELPTEAEAASAINVAKSVQLNVSGKKPSPFNSTAVQPAPNLLQSLTSAGNKPVILPVAPKVPMSSHTQVAINKLPIKALVPALKFGMTLQNTDVGIGQTSTGTARRSPEIFIPIGAIDLNPNFWGWINQSLADPKKYKPDLMWRAKNSVWIAKRNAASRRVIRPLDKLDWEHVMVNLVGHNGCLDVAVWFNPDKVDIRFREANLRSAGDIDDILVVSQPSQGANYDYDMEVIRKNDPRYSSTFKLLTEKAPGGSLKRYGYF